MTRRRKPRALLARRHDAAVETAARTRRAQPVVALPTDGRFTHPDATAFEVPASALPRLRQDVIRDVPNKRNGGRDTGFRRTAPGILPSWVGVTAPEDEGYERVSSHPRGNAHDENLWRQTDARTGITPSIMGTSPTAPRRRRIVTVADHPHRPRVVRLDPAPAPEGEATATTRQKRRF